MMMSKYIIEKEFKGIKGVAAYHAALTFVRSIYYLPMICPERDYFKAVEWFDGLPEDKKRKMLKVAIDDGAQLEEDEIFSLLHFAKDSNGVPVGKESINNLDAFEIQEIILEVACEIFKAKVFFCQTTK
tara:strand:- start:670 stop:1056 length:387 start_codon:yes stop_codon:yes gene_type:complete